MPTQQDISTHYTHGDLIASIRDGIEKLTRQLLHGSGDGFMQPHHLLLEDGRKGLNCDNSMSEGPKLNEIGPFVSRKVFPNGRAEEVNVKLTDNQRSNLRVAVFLTSRNIWR